jgi:hypothetical protein
MSSIVQQKAIQEELIVWKLRVDANLSESEISERTGIERTKVSRILTRVARRLSEKLDQTVMLYRVEQTDKLNRIYASAMEAWEASRKPKERKTKRTMGTGTIEEETMETETSSGDPRLLQEARLALDSLRELWGLEIKQDGVRRSANELPMVSQVNFNAPVTIQNTGKIAELAQPSSIDAEFEGDDDAPSPEK